MSPTVLILGAGPGIGAHSASLFGVAGYNVVTASRKLQDNTKSGSYLELHVDLAKPETIRPLLQKVKGFFGHPDVVIYNGAAMTLGPAEDPLSTLSIDTIEHDTAVNVTSALMAAHEAVKGWNEDPGNSNKTFIYTGNRQNVMADPKALTFGMAKTAAAKMMWDCCTAYAPKRYKYVSPVARCGVTRHRQKVILTR